MHSKCEWIIKNEIFELLILSLIENPHNCLNECKMKAKRGISRVLKWKLFLSQLMSEEKEKTCIKSVRLLVLHHATIYINTSRLGDLVSLSSECKKRTNRNIKTQQKEILFSWKQKRKERTNKNGCEWWWIAAG